MNKSALKNADLNWNIHFTARLRSADKFPFINKARQLLKNKSSLDRPRRQVADEEGGLADIDDDDGQRGDHQPRAEYPEIGIVLGLKVHKPQGQRL